MSSSALPRQKSDGEPHEDDTNHEKVAREKVEQNMEAFNVPDYLSTSILDIIDRTYGAAIKLLRTTGERQKRIIRRQAKKIQELLSLLSTSEKDTADSYLEDIDDFGEIGHGQLAMSSELLQEVEEIRGKLAKSQRLNDQLKRQNQDLHDALDSEKKANARRELWRQNNEMQLRDTGTDPVADSSSSIYITPELQRWEELEKERERASTEPERTFIKRKIEEVQRLHQESKKALSEALQREKRAERMHQGSIEKLEAAKKMMEMAEKSRGHYNQVIRGGIPGMPGAGVIDPLRRKEEEKRGGTGENLFTQMARKFYDKGHRRRE